MLSINTFPEKSLKWYFVDFQSGIQAKIRKFQMNIKVEVILIVLNIWGSNQRDNESKQLKSLHRQDSKVE